MNDNDNVKMKGGVKIIKRFCDNTCEIIHDNTVEQTPERKRVKRVSHTLCADCTHCNKPSETCPPREWECREGNRIMYNKNLPAITEFSEKTGNWRHCKDADMRKGWQIWHYMHTQEYANYFKQNRKVEESVQELLKSMHVEIDNEEFAKLSDEMVMKGFNNDDENERVE